MRGENSKQRPACVTTARPTTHDVRMNLWCTVAVAVARAENCRDMGAPGAWADRALADFDAKFGVING